eukprot:5253505-Pyramimonas_sp.AAC.1
MLLLIPISRQVAAPSSRKDVARDTLSTFNFTCSSSDIRLDSHMACTASIVVVSKCDDELPTALSSM